MYYYGLLAQLNGSLPSMCPASLGSIPSPANQCKAKQGKTSKQNKERVFYK